MRPWIYGCCAIILTTGAAVSGFASPATFRLLPLVPSGAEVVAGFENSHEPSTTGRLLLTTHNNRLDFDDWLALAGVDNQRVFDEIVEVASSRSGGELTEHLLLVAGHFDGERIYRSLEQNGANATHFDAVKIFVVEPFGREKGEMLDTRWLVTLNDRIAMFGTELLVQNALERYFSHAVPDPVLLERLGRLRPDVTSWNVLESAPMEMKNMSFAKAHGAWARLMEDSDVMMVGARFGAKIRVDLVESAAGQGENYFSQRAALFSGVFAETSSTEATPSESVEPRLANLLIQEHCVKGSVTLSRKQFEEWREGQLARNIAARESAAASVPTRGN